MKKKGNNVITTGEKAASSTGRKAITALMLLKQTKKYVHIF